MSRIQRSVGILVAALLSGAVHAGTCSWAGTLTGNWSLPGNWTLPCTTPQTGDDLVFPDSGSNKAMIDDIANLSVNSIGFTGTGGGYALTGTGNLTITGANAITSKTASPNTNTLNLTNAMKFGAATAAIDITAATGGKLFLNGPIDLNGSTLNFVWSSLQSFIIVNGAISGAGGIVTNGGGSNLVLELHGNNTFTGPVEVKTGYLGVFHANALGAGGSAADGTTIRGGGTLILASDIGNEYLTLDYGSGQSGNGMIQATGVHNWGGPVTLNSSFGAVTDIHLLSGGIQFLGPLAGNGGFSCCLYQGGIVILANAGNSYSGPSRLDNEGGRLQAAVNNALSPNSAVALTGSVSSVLDLQGFSASIAALTGGYTASLAIATGQTLTVAGDVTLDGTTLLLSSTGSPPLGTVFKILDKTSGGPITGTFAQLAEGDAIAVGSTSMKISYAGGNGNDVTLTVQAPGPTHTVSVLKQGSGSGTVTGNLGAINCPGACSDTYVEGTQLTLTAHNDPGNYFVGWLGPCTGDTTCVFIVKGNTTVRAVFAPAGSFPNPLDVDGNETYDALTDGLLALRYLFGVTGSGLTANALGPTPSRVIPGDIVAYLDNIAPLLDIDGNGQLDPYTDGVLIVRFLMGLRGDALIADAVGAGARRKDSDSIESRLYQLVP